MIFSSVDSSLHLRLHLDSGEERARAALLGDVFGSSPEQALPQAGWQSLAFFTDAGVCVASAECGRLPLIIDGRPMRGAGLRRVGVAEPWRRRGLSRALVQAGIRWAEEGGLAPLFLYTAEPALYARSGFVPVAQHSFVGPAPMIVARASQRRLDPAADAALIRDLVTRRAPVSQRVAMAGDPDLFLAALDGAEDDWQLAYGIDDDILLVYALAHDRLLIADVAARSMPSLAQVLALVPSAVERVATLFSPDLLGWSGRPIVEDRGLMALGPLPPAMRQPFMLPPTAEF
jgi:predicted N-acetyltransferase YhbS